MCVGVLVRDCVRALVDLQVRVDVSLCECVCKM